MKVRKRAGKVGGVAVIGDVETFFASPPGTPPTRMRSAEVRSVERSKGGKDSAPYTMTKLLARKGLPVLFGTFCASYMGVGIAYYNKTF